MIFQIKKKIIFKILFNDYLFIYFFKTLLRLKWFLKSSRNAMHVFEIQAFNRDDLIA